jgi:hypothetical protein
MSQLNDTNWTYNSIMAAPYKIQQVPTFSGFPEVKARNLNGLELRIPNDLHNRATILIVALKRCHLSMVESWLPQLEELCQEIPGTVFYELPTMPALYAPVRGIIDNGIVQQHGGKKDTAEHTFTVYTNQSAFMKNARIASADTIHVFLLDRSGQVAYRATGPWTELKGRVLRESVVSLD